MNLITQRLFVIIFLVLSTGCTTLAPEVTALTPVSKAQFVTVEAPVVRLLDKGRMEQGLLPGIYHSTFENSLGTFFQGPSHAFFERRLPNEPVYIRTGGFWAPKSSSVRPRFYFVHEPEIYSAATVDAAIQAVKNPSTGQFAGVKGAGGGVQAVGGALAGALVSAMIESVRGQHALLGEAPDDGLLPKLEALVSKIPPATPAP